MDSNKTTATIAGIIGAVAIVLIMNLTSCNMEQHRIAQAKYEACVKSGKQWLVTEGPRNSAAQQCLWFVTPEIVEALTRN